MDNTISFYKQCVKKLLCQYEDLKDGDSQIELIFDDERMRYMAVWVGWYKYKRIHECAVHIDIVAGNSAVVGDSHRIIIQRNDTEDSIVAQLVEMGISQNNISLSFIHPAHRGYAEQEGDVVAAITS
jgi:XisI protein